MSQTISIALPRFGTAIAYASAARRQSQRAKTKSLDAKPNGSAGLGFGAGNTQVSWKCMEGCGACCKLDKGSNFPTPEEIFDDPQDVEVYKSLIGPDGWCIHYEKSTHKCSIYTERPYFCRVEPEIFEKLYGIEKRKFNKSACSCCIDTIKAIYGPNSEELKRYNRAIRSSDSD